MYTCMCDWVTLLGSKKLTEYCKSAIMEKIKVIIKKKLNFCVYICNKHTVQNHLPSLSRRRRHPFLLTLGRTTVSGADFPTPWPWAQSHDRLWSRGH